MNPRSLKTMTVGQLGLSEERKSLFAITVCLS